MSNVDNAFRFAAGIHEFMAVRYPALCLSVSHDFAWQAIEYVVFGTPWITGHTRFNTQVGFFGPVTTEIAGVDPAGFNTVIRERTRILNARPFQNLHVSNPVPWSIALEAKYGMFRNAMARVAAEAKAIGARGYERWRLQHGG